LHLLRHGKHGASSEKINRQIEQYELMLDEIEATHAEAEADKSPLPETQDQQEKAKRRPLPDNLPTEDKVYVAPCNRPTCGGTSFLKAADKVEGHRWAIEDSFETAKNELGLDHNETHSWHGWHCHVSLVMIAFAMMAIIRHQANRAQDENKTAKKTNCLTMNTGNPST
jgi:hypothetical protein